MALDTEPVEAGDGSGWLAHARQFEARPAGEGYTGVGDELAQPDLVCGVAEPAGFGLVVPGGAGPHHAVQPQAHGEDQG